jgi:hypothetical protein
MGAKNEVYTSTRYTGRPCRVRALSGNEQIQLGEQKVVATFRIYFDADTNIKETDQIQNIKSFDRLGNLRSTDTNGYEPRFADDPNRMGVFVQADLVLRQQNATRSTA